MPAGLAAAWTGFIVLVGMVPSLLPAISGAIPRRLPLTVASRVKASLGDIAHALLFAAANLVFFGHQASLMVDAIGRTLYRLAVSRKNLLEWTTAAQAEASHSPGIIGNYRLMAVSVAFGLFAAVIAIDRGDGIALVTLPFALSWLAAPAIAFWMSRSSKLEDELESSPDDRKTLRHGCPPDMAVFRDFRHPGGQHAAAGQFPGRSKAAGRPSHIAHQRRALSSVRCQRAGIRLAWPERLVGRIEATLATVKRLEKYRGHLYNWYDTANLQPLEPKYVSTVDSGNLAGHLIALSNVCSSWIIRPADVAANLGRDRRHPRYSPARPSGNSQ